MKPNKYQLLTFALLCGILVGSTWNTLFQLNSNLNKNDSSPNVAQTQNSTLDFEITSHNSYWDTCQNMFKFEIRVKSISNSIPTQVIASMNGTNYSLNAEYYNSGGFRENNITVGIYYTNYICEMLEGNYTVFYHIINATGSFVKNYTVIVNKSVSNWFALGERQISACNYEIYAELWSQRNCTLPINATIGIENQNYSMTWRSVEKEWFYLYLGNCSRSFSIIPYNVTLIYASGYTEFLTTSLWFDPIVTEISVDQENYISQNIQTGEIIYEFYFEYIDRLNLTVQQLILEKNGQNDTLSVKIPTEYYKYIQSRECYKIEWLFGGILGPYQVTILANTTYNLTIWAFDGTSWVSDVIWTNQIWQLAPIADISIAYLNQSVFTQYSSHYLNLTFNITSAINDFDIDRIYMFYRSPFSNGFSSLIYQKDYFDDNFTDGKTYYIEKDLLSMNTVLYGIYEYYFVIYYTNTTGNYLGIWESELYNITYSTVTQISLKVNANEWYVFKNTYSTNSCCPCGDSGEGSSYYAYEIISTGYRLGMNYIAYRYYSWTTICDKDGEWSNQDIYNSHKSQYLFGFVHKFVDNVSYSYIDPDDARFYGSFSVIDFDKYYEYYISRFPSNYVTKSGTSFKIAIKNGCWDLETNAKVNSNGIITESSSILKIGDCYKTSSKTILYAAGTGSLPTNLQNAQKSGTYRATSEENVLQNLLDTIMPTGFWSQIIFSSLLLIAVGITLFAQKMKNKDSAISSGGISKDSNEPSIN